MLLKVRERKNPEVTAFRGLLIFFTMVVLFFNLSSNSFSLITLLPPLILLGFFYLFSYLAMGRRQEFTIYENYFSVSFTPNPFKKESIEIDYTDIREIAFSDRCSFSYGGRYGNRDNITVYISVGAQDRKGNYTNVYSSLFMLGFKELNALRLLLLEKVDWIENFEKEVPFGPDDRRYEYEENYQRGK